MSRTAAWTTCTGRIGDHRIGLAEMDDNLYRVEHELLAWTPLPPGDLADINDRADAWLTEHGWQRTGKWTGDGSGWSMLAPIAKETR